MKRFHKKLRIMLLTIALGLASVPFFRMIHERWTEIRVDVPQTESSETLIVTPYERLEVKTITGGRDLTLYDFGGYYPYCREDNSAETQQCEANLKEGRSFIWKHWTDKKQGYVIAGKNDHIFIEPDKNEEWHIAAISEYSTYSWGKMVDEADFRSLEFMRDLEDVKESKHREKRLWFCDWEGKCYRSL